MRYWKQWVTMVGAGAALVAAACADVPSAPSTTPLSAGRPPAAPAGARLTPQEFEAAARAAQPLADSVARLFALAMADDAVRGAVRDAMRASLIDEHAVRFPQFASTPAGRQLIAAAARAGGLTTGAVTATIERLPALDFSVPVREHRRSWQGGADVLVVAALYPSAPKIAHAPTGASRDASRDKAGDLPTLFALQLAEHKGNRVRPQPAVPGTVIEDVNDGVGSAVFLWKSRSGDSLLIDLSAPDADAKIGRLQSMIAHEATLRGGGAVGTSGSAPAGDRTIAGDGGVTPMTLPTCEQDPTRPYCEPPPPPQAPADTTLLDAFVVHFCDDDSCAFNNEVRFDLDYYAANGTFLGHGQLWQGSTNPNTWYNRQYPILFKRIRQGSGEYIRLGLVEEDRSEPFGYNKDDYCGTLTVGQAQNNVLLEWPNTSGCDARGQNAYRAAAAYVKWTPKY